MKYVLLLLSVLSLIGCDNFPEEKATKVGTEEYKDFKSSLYLEHPDYYSGLYEPADGAKTANTVANKSYWMEPAKVEAQLSNSKIFVMSDQGTKDICVLASDTCDIPAPAGCLYPYDKNPKVIVNVSTARREPFVRMKIACHEYLHEAMYKETFDFDSGHTDPVVWQKQAGKDSIEYRCAKEALVL